MKWKLFFTKEGDYHRLKFYDGKVLETYPDAIVKYHPDKEIETFDFLGEAFDFCPIYFNSGGYYIENDGNDDGFYEIPQSVFEKHITDLSSTHQPPEAGVFFKNYQFKNLKEDLKNKIADLLEIEVEVMDYSLNSLKKLHQKLEKYIPNFYFVFYIMGLIISYASLAIIRVLSEHKGNFVIEQVFDTSSIQGGIVENGLEFGLMIGKEVKFGLMATYHEELNGFGISSDRLNHNIGVDLVFIQLSILRNNGISLLNFDGDDIDYASLSNDLIIFL